jgi:hypothetical protein
MLKGDMVILDGINMATTPGPGGVTKKAPS